ncbi:MAG: SMP-30/gluconolactonase/LRE family protein [Candidatus Solibacter sp.]
MRAHRVLGLLAIALFSVGGAGAQQYVISTIAGGAPPATPSTAINASIGDPTRLFGDSAGNIYFSSLHSVFKVDTSGTLTRFAGNGRAGNSGDGGPAASAQLNFPMGIAIDAGGNVFIADRDSHVVRKVAANGTITTVAGSGAAGYSGDGGSATSARINKPLGVAVDASGNIFIADFGNEAVRKVTAAGVISTYAGTGTRGYQGDGGPARSAPLDGPEAVAVDAQGNVYIADTFNGRIRRVSTDGTITTFAGIGTTGVFSGDGGPAQAAALSLPTDVAVDGAGNVYIADFGNSKVRQVTNGTINTVAGRTNGAPLLDGEAAVNARLEGPTGVTPDVRGNFYFVEAGLGSGSGLAVSDYKVWKVSSAGILTTFAGNGIPNYSGDGAATATQLNGPAGIALGPGGIIYITDTQNQRVRTVAPGGALTTVAGTGVAGFNGEIVTPKLANLYRPNGVAADGQGNWYLADTGNNRIRKVQPGGNLFTIAGNGNASYFGDGQQGTRASVNHPDGVAVDSQGNVYIADTLDNVIRRVAPDGIISTFAGTGASGYGGDNGPATQARLRLPSGVAVDGQGNVFVADTGNNQIRRIDASGFITTVDTGGALNEPRGVAVDRTGNVYIADTGNHVVRRVSPGALITTIAGTGECCYSGDGGLAIEARLSQPWGIAVDGNGNVYIADSANNSVRTLSPVSAAITVTSVTNAASNLAGPVAPGELVAIYGSGLGGVRSVLFNGVSAPLLYAMPTQVGAVVPYAVAGASVNVSVQSTGAASAPVAVPVAATSPGIFTADGSGRGQAVALNQNGAPNGSSAPAGAGSVVAFFATGEGQTQPGGVDGKLATPPFPEPVALVKVTVGGVAAEVRYAAAAPGQIAGVMQVNVVIPNGLTGNVAVVLTVGQAQSQGGVTLAVQ